MNHDMPEKEGTWNRQEGMRLLWEGEQRIMYR